MALYLNPIDNPAAFDTMRIGKIFTPGKVRVTGWSRKNDSDVKVGKGTAGATETLKGQPPAEGEFKFWAWTPAHFAAWNSIEAMLTYKPGKGSQASSSAQQAPSAASAGQFSVGQTKSDAGTANSSGAIPEPGNTTGTSKDADKKDDKSPPALSKNDAIDIFYPTLADIGVSAIIPPDELGAWEEEGEGSGMWVRTVKAKEFVQAPNTNIATTPTGASDGNAPGDTPAGKQEGAAPGGAAGSANGAGSDAQGAWGAP